MLAALDLFPQCFSETPGVFDLAEHEIPVTGNFLPKRLREYKVPERLKPEVSKQIHELLALGFSRPSKSRMVSPLMCVLKGEDGKGGVRLAVDYQQKEDGGQVSRVCVCSVIFIYLIEHLTISARNFARTFRTLSPGSSCNSYL